MVTAQELYRLQAAAMSEDELQAAILDPKHGRAAHYGWTLAFHDTDPRLNRAGFPDLVLLRAPVLLFVELKTQRGRVRPDQALWLAGLEEVAALAPNVLVRIWRPIDLLDGTIDSTLRRPLDSHP
jgi:hypothetical protein